MPRHPGERGDGVIPTDSARGVVFVNAAAEVLTGWTLRDAAGQPLDAVCAFVTEDGRQPVENPAVRALRDVSQNGATVHELEVEQDFPEIGPRTMVLDSSRFASASRDTDLILVAIEDIAGRKRAESAAQASEGRYRRLFETARDGILILDLDTRKIIEANPFMTELLGYTLGEFVGKELWQLGFFEDKAASEVAYRLLEETGYVRYDHLPLETQAGEKVEVEFVSNGYVVGGARVAQCNVRDISARSRMERALQEQTTTLADLHTRKDEFLAMLSHELRSPLAPILNAVQLLRLQSGGALPQAEAVQIIHRQVGRLKHIVVELHHGTLEVTSALGMGSEFIVRPAGTRRLQGRALDAAHAARRRTGRRHRVRAGHGPATCAGIGFQPPPREARRLRQSAGHPGGRCAAGAMTPVSCAIASAMRGAA